MVGLLIGIANQQPPTVQADQRLLVSLDETFSEEMFDPARL
jgi:hypothetical protein